VIGPGSADLLDLAGLNNQSINQFISILCSSTNKSSLDGDTPFHLSLNDQPQSELAATFRTQLAFYHMFFRLADPDNPDGQRILENT
jgi:hypothetical protein